MMNEANKTLSKSEWQQTCLQRTAVYGWFSALYAQELSESMLASYGAGEMTALLEGLRSVGLVDESHRLQATVDALHAIPSIEVLDVLRKINANGKTVIMATHDYALLMKFPSKTLKCEDANLFEVVQKTI